MALAYVDNLADPRVAVYRDLKDRALSARDRLFVGEGAYAVQRMLAAGIEMHSLLLAQRRVEEFVELVPDDVTIYVLPNELIHQVVGFKFHSGVIACGRRPANRTLDDVLADDAQAQGPETIVVCPKVINHENVGAMIRVAAAFGAKAMVLGPESCDPYWRRSIRVSMGAVFTFPIVTSDDLQRDLKRLKDRWGYQLAATVIDADAEPLARAGRPSNPDRLALLFGPESQGLENRWVQMCDRRITIPMQLGTDSLNIAVAAAVFLYHFTQPDGVAGNRFG